VSLFRLSFNDTTRRPVLIDSKLAKMSEAFKRVLIDLSNIATATKKMPFLSGSRQSITVCNTATTLRSDKAELASGSSIQTNSRSG
jgi:hypothetical protein